MCNQLDGQCRRHAVAAHGKLLLGHLRHSTCGPDCDCTCHELPAHSHAPQTFPSHLPTRHQQTGWRLVTCVYSDRWMKAAA